MRPQDKEKPTNTPTKKSNFYTNPKTLGATSDLKFPKSLLGQRKARNTSKNVAINSKVSPKFNFGPRSPKRLELKDNLLGKLGRDSRIPRRNQVEIESATNVGMRGSPRTVRTNGSLITDSKGTLRRRGPFPKVQKIKSTFSSSSARQSSNVVVRKSKLVMSLSKKLLAKVLAETIKVNSRYRSVISKKISKRFGPPKRSQIASLIKNLNVEKSKSNSYDDGEGSPKKSRTNEGGNSKLSPKHVSASNSQSNTYLGTSGTASRIKLPPSRVGIGNRKNVSKSNQKTTKDKHSKTVSKIHKLKDNAKDTVSKTTKTKNIHEPKKSDLSTQKDTSGKDEFRRMPSIKSVQAFTKDNLKSESVYDISTMAKKPTKSLLNKFMKINESIKLKVLLPARSIKYESPDPHYSDATPMAFGPRNSKENVPIEKHNIIVTELPRDPSKPIINSNVFIDPQTRHSQIKLPKVFKSSTRKRKTKRRSKSTTVSTKNRKKTVKSKDFSTKTRKTKKSKEFFRFKKLQKNADKSESKFRRPMEKSSTKTRAIPKTAKSLPKVQNFVPNLSPIAENSENKSSIKSLNKKFFSIDSQKSFLRTELTRANTNDNFMADSKYDIVRSKVAVKSVIKSVKKLTPKFRSKLASPVKSDINNLVKETEVGVHEKLIFVKKASSLGKMRVLPTEIISTAELLHYTESIKKTLKEIPKSAKSPKFILERSSKLKTFKKLVATFKDSEKKSVSSKVILGEVTRKSIEKSEISKSTQTLDSIIYVDTPKDETLKSFQANIESENSSLLSDVNLSFKKMLQKHMKSLSPSPTKMSGGLVFANRASKVHVEPQTVLSKNKSRKSSGQKKQTLVMNIIKRLTMNRLKNDKTTTEKVVETSTKSRQSISKSLLKLKLFQKSPASSPKVPADRCRNDGSLLSLRDRSPPSSPGGNVTQPLDFAKADDALEQVDVSVDKRITMKDKLEEMTQRLLLKDTYTKIITKKVSRENILITDQSEDKFLKSPVKIKIKKDPSRKEFQTDPLKGVRKMTATSTKALAKDLMKKEHTKKRSVMDSIKSKLQKSRAELTKEKPNEMLNLSTGANRRGTKFISDNVTKATLPKSRTKSSKLAHRHKTREPSGRPKLKQLSRIMQKQDDLSPLTDTEVTRQKTKTSITKAKPSEAEQNKKVESEARLSKVTYSTQGPQGFDGHPSIAPETPVVPLRLSKIDPLASNVTFDARNQIPSNVGGTPVVPQRLSKMDPLASTFTMDPAKKVGSQHFQPISNVGGTPVVPQRLSKMDPLLSGVAFDARNQHANDHLQPHTQLRAPSTTGGNVMITKSTMEAGSCFVDPMKDDKPLNLPASKCHQSYIPPPVMSEIKHDINQANHEAFPAPVMSKVRHDNVPDKPEAYADPMKDDKALNSPVSRHHQSNIEAPVTSKVRHDNVPDKHEAYADPMKDDKALNSPTSRHHQSNIEAPVTSKVRHDNVPDKHEAYADPMKDDKALNSPTSRHHQSNIEAPVTSKVRHDNLPDKPEVFADPMKDDKALNSPTSRHHQSNIEAPVTSQMKHEIKIESCAVAVQSNYPQPVVSQMKHDAHPGPQSYYPPPVVSKVQHDNVPDKADPYVDPMKDDKPLNSPHFKGIQSYYPPPNISKVHELSPESAVIIHEEPVVSKYLQSNYPQPSVSKANHEIVLDKPEHFIDPMKNDKPLDFPKAPESPHFPKIAVVPEKPEILKKIVVQKTKPKSKFEPSPSCYTIGSKYKAVEMHNIKILQDDVDAPKAGAAKTAPKEKIRKVSTKQTKDNQTRIRETKAENRHVENKVATKKTTLKEKRTPTVVKLKEEKRVTITPSPSPVKKYSEKHMIESKFAVSAIDFSLVSKVVKAKTLPEKEKKTIKKASEKRKVKPESEMRVKVLESKSEQMRRMIAEGKNQDTVDYVYKSVVNDGQPTHSKSHLEQPTCGKSLLPPKSDMNEDEKLEWKSEEDGQMKIIDAVMKEHNEGLFMKTGIEESPKNQDFKMISSKPSSKLIVKEKTEKTKEPTKEDKAAEKEKTGKTTESKKEDQLVEKEKVQTVDSSRSTTKEQKTEHSKTATEKKTGGEAKKVAAKEISNSTSKDPKMEPSKTVSEKTGIETNKVPLMEASRSTSKDPKIEPSKTASEKTGGEAKKVSTKEISDSTSKDPKMEPSKTASEKTDIETNKVSLKETSRSISQDPKMEPSKTVSEKTGGEAKKVSLKEASTSTSKDPKMEPSKTASEKTGVETNKVSLKETSRSISQDPKMEPSKTVSEKTGIETNKVPLKEASTSTSKDPKMEPSKTVSEKTGGEAKKVSLKEASTSTSKDPKMEPSKTVSEKTGGEAKKVATKEISDSTSKDPKMESSKTASEKTGVETNKVSLKEASTSTSKDPKIEPSKTITEKRTVSGKSQAKEATKTTTQKHKTDPSKTITEKKTVAEANKVPAKEKTEHTKTTTEKKTGGEKNKVAAKDSGKSFSAKSNASSPSSKSGIKKVDSAKSDVQSYVKSEPELSKTVMIVQDKPSDTLSKQKSEIEPSSSYKQGSVVAEVRSAQASTATEGKSTNVSTLADAKSTHVSTLSKAGQSTNYQQESVLPKSAELQSVDLQSKSNVQSAVDPKLAAKHQKTKVKLSKLSAKGAHDEDEDNKKFKSLVDKKLSTKSQPKDLSEVKTTISRESKAESTNSTTKGGKDVLSQNHPKSPASPKSLSNKKKEMLYPKIDSSANLNSVAKGKAVEASSSAMKENQESVPFKLAEPIFEKEIILKSKMESLFKMSEFASSKDKASAKEEEESSKTAVKSGHSNKSKDSKRLKITSKKSKSSSTKKPTNDNVKKGAILENAAAGSDMKGKNTFNEAASKQGVGVENTQSVSRPSKSQAPGTNTKQESEAEKTTRVSKAYSAKAKNESVVEKTSRVSKAYPTNTPTTNPDDNTKTKKAKTTEKTAIVSNAYHSKDHSVYSDDNTKAKQESTAEKVPILSNAYHSKDHSVYSDHNAKSKQESVAEKAIVGSNVCHSKNHSVYSDDNTKVKQESEAEKAPILSNAYHSKDHSVYSDHNAKSKQESVAEKAIDGSNVCNSKNHSIYSDNNTKAKPESVAEKATMISNAYNSKNHSIYSDDNTKAKQESVAEKAPIFSNAYNSKNHSVYSDDNTKAKLESVAEKATSTLNANHSKYQSVFSKDASKASKVSKAVSAMQSTALNQLSTDKGNISLSAVNPSGTGVEKETKAKVETNKTKARPKESSKKEPPAAAKTESAKEEDYKLVSGHISMRRSEADTVSKVGSKISTKTLRGDNEEAKETKHETSKDMKMNTEVGAKFGVSKSKSKLDEIARKTLSSTKKWTKLKSAKSVVQKEIDLGKKDSSKKQSLQKIVSSKTVEEYALKEGKQYVRKTVIEEKTVKTTTYQARKTESKTKKSGTKGKSRSTAKMDDKADDSVSKRESGITKKSSNEKATKSGTIKSAIPKHKSLRPPSKGPTDDDTNTARFHKPAIEGKLALSGLEQARVRLDSVRSIDKEGYLKTDFDKNIDRTGNLKVESRRMQMDDTPDGWKDDGSKKLPRDKMFEGAGKITKLLDPGKWFKKDSGSKKSKRSLQSTKSKTDDDSKVTATNESCKKILKLVMEEENKTTIIEYTVQSSKSVTTNAEIESKKSKPLGKSWDSKDNDSKKMPKQPPDDDPEKKPPSKKFVPKELSTKSKKKVKRTKDGTDNKETSSQKTTKSKAAEGLRKLSLHHTSLIDDDMKLKPLKSSQHSGKLLDKSKAQIDSKVIISRPVTKVNSAKGLSAEVKFSKLGKELIRRELDFEKFDRPKNIKSALESYKSILTDKKEVNDDDDQAPKVKVALVTLKTIQEKHTIKQETTIVTKVVHKSLLRSASQAKPDTASRKSSSVDGKFIKSRKSNINRSIRASNRVSLKSESLIDGIPRKRIAEASLKMALKEKPEVRAARTASLRPVFLVDEKTRVVQKQQMPVMVVKDRMETFSDKITLKRIWVPGTDRAEKAIVEIEINSKKAQPLVISSSSDGSKKFPRKQPPFVDDKPKTLGKKSKTKSTKSASKEKDESGSKIVFKQASGKSSNKNDSKKIKFGQDFTRQGSLLKKLREKSAITDVKSPLEEKLDLVVQHSQVSVLPDTPSMEKTLQNLMEFGLSKGKTEVIAKTPPQIIQQKSIISSKSKPQEMKSQWNIKDRLELIAQKLTINQKPEIDILKSMGPYTSAYKPQSEIKFAKKGPKLLEENASVDLLKSTRKSEVLDGLQLSQQKSLVSAKSAKKIRDMPSSLKLKKEPARKSPMDSKFDNNSLVREATKRIMNDKSDLFHKITSSDFEKSSEIKSTVVSDKLLNKTTPKSSFNAPKKTSPILDKSYTNERYQVACKKSIMLQNQTKSSQTVEKVLSSPSNKTADTKSTMDKITIKVGSLKVKSISPKTKSTPASTSAKGFKTKLPPLLCDEVRELPDKSFTLEPSKSKTNDKYIETKSEKIMKKIEKTLSASESRKLQEKVSKSKTTTLKKTKTEQKSSVKHITERTVTKVTKSLSKQVSQIVSVDSMTNSEKTYLHIPSDKDKEDTVKMVICYEKFETTKFIPKEKLEAPKSAEKVLPAKTTIQIIDSAALKIFTKSSITEKLRKHASDIISDTSKFDASKSTIRAKSVLSEKNSKNESISFKNSIPVEQKEKSLSTLRVKSVTDEPVRHHKSNATDMDLELPKAPKLPKPKATKMKSASIIVDPKEITERLKSTLKVMTPKNDIIDLQEQPKSLVEIMKSIVETSNMSMEQITTKTEIPKSLMKLKTRVISNKLPSDKGFLIEKTRRISIKSGFDEPLSTTKVRTPSMKTLSSLPMRIQSSRTDKRITDLQVLKTKLSSDTKVTKFIKESSVSRMKPPRSKLKPMKSKVEESRSWKLKDSDSAHSKSDISLGSTDLMRIKQFKTVKFQTIDTENISSLQRSRQRMLKDDSSKTMKPKASSKPKTVACQIFNTEMKSKDTQVPAKNEAFDIVLGLDSSEDQTKEYVLDTKKSLENEEMKLKSDSSSISDQIISKRKMKKMKRYSEDKNGLLPPSSGAVRRKSRRSVQSWKISSPTNKQVVRTLKYEPVVAGREGHDSIVSTESLLDLKSIKSGVNESNSAEHITTTTTTTTTTTSKNVTQENRQIKSTFVGSNKCNKRVKSLSTKKHKRRRDSFPADPDRYKKIASVRSKVGAELDTKYSTPSTMYNASQKLSAKKVLSLKTAKEMSEQIGKDYTKSFQINRTTQITNETMTMHKTPNQASMEEIENMHTHYLRRFMLAYNQYKNNPAIFGIENLDRMAIFLSEFWKRYMAEIHRIHDEDAGQPSICKSKQSHEQHLCRIALSLLCQNNRNTALFIKRQYSQQKTKRKSPNSKKSIPEI